MLGLLVAIIISGRLATMEVDTSAYSRDELLNADGLEIIYTPPKEEDYTPPDYGVIREVSAYTSRVAETDNTPCIGAGGNICKMYESGIQVFASNAFDLGTKIYVEGIGEGVVMDRMNSRYKNSVDVYMGYDLERALKWGRRKVKVKKI